MDIKDNRVIAAFSKYISNVKSDRSKLLKSIVSLSLAFVILITCTFCWYYIKTAKGSADNFLLDAGKGLRVNDTGTTDFQSSDNNFDLLPASSVDGRNIFFPTDGTDFSDVTKEMTFRSANAGDKNNNYIQIDFTLTAQSNHTAIYLNTDNDKTSLKVKNGDNDEGSAQLAAPLRMAIWASAPDSDDNVVAPVVFNSQAKTVTSAAVSEVDRGSGTYLSNAPQTAHQFSDYAYGGTPITTLSAGKETQFSVIIWLEGTDPKCNWNRMNTVNKNDIELKIAFKTSWDNTEVIRFKDDTQNKWIKTLMTRTQAQDEKDPYTLSLRYTNPNDSTDTLDFNMYKYPSSANDSNVTEWSTSIPGDMKNKITFILSPPAGTNESTYVFCRKTNDHSTSTENRGVNRQYVVKNAAYSTVSECEGAWTALGDSDGGGLDIGDLDGDDF